MEPGFCRVLRALIPCLAAAGPLAAAQIPGNSSLVSYEGRTVVTAGGTVRLGYPGIVTRVRLRGTGLALRARTTSPELTLDVGIDGNTPTFVKVPKGESAVVLAQGLPDAEHSIEIHKRVESAVGVLEVVSFDVKGELLPPTPLPDRRLMFLGDSFTAGQATTVEDGGAPMDPSKAMRQNARLSYGRLLADRLHAQSHIIAVAGRGVVRDWQGVRGIRLAPEYYEYAIPDEATLWDPKAYVPDAIGVCLGNNDFGIGVPDQAEYVAAYTEFIRKLRRDAPKALIFLILSPSLGDEPGKVPMRSVQRAFFDEMVVRLADPRVRVLPIARYAVVPGDWHPSGTAHRAVADEIEPVHRDALGWKP